MKINRLPEEVVAEPLEVGGQCSRRRRQDWRKPDKGSVVSIIGSFLAPLEGEEDISR